MSVIPESVICEEDSEKGGYCIDCFGPPLNGRGKLYFFNSDGPFCGSGCYAKYIGVEKRQLPTIDWQGVVRD